MNLNIASGGTVTVSEVAFGKEFNEPLVHQVVTAFMAGGRQGSQAQKNPSEVRGGGKKPGEKKRTGRARAGTIRSPLWRSGGVTFAAKPRDFEQKVNRKMYRGAMRCILSELVRQGRLVVVQDLVVAEPKTKLLLAKLKELQVESALIVAGEVSENLFLSARNLPRVDVCDVQAADPVSLIAHDKVIITVDALKKIEELLA